MFLRPDFFNLTICVVALYMMFNTDMITKGKFRMLVIAVVISFFYDLAWLYFSESEGDGSVETTIRKFSLLMAYASFILRVNLSLLMLILVFRCDCLMEGFFGFR